MHLLVILLSLPARVNPSVLRKNLNVIDIVRQTVYRHLSVVHVGCSVADDGLNCVCHSEHFTAGFLPAFI